MDNQVQTIKKWLGSGSINIFGPPFAGKDTQASKLATILDGQTISGGDILRDNDENEELQRILAAGDIIPSELFLRLVPQYFSHSELVGKPLFLSEVGRLTTEVEPIMSALQATDHSLKAVILLNLPDERVWEHFEISQQTGDRGERADDNRKTLIVRLEKYKKVLPVIEHYRDQGLLLEVDGTKTPEQVTEEILSSLESVSRSA